MFADACKIARQFTHPVIISHLGYDGTCGSSIGAYVVVNRDGWFVTANHIIQMLESYAQTKSAIQQYDAAVAQIEGDQTISPKERRRRLAAMKKPPASAPRRFSDWWGPGRKVEKVHALADVDLALGKFANFTAAAGSVYPKFKDPAKPIDQGTTLCKLGYPFYNITPTFDEATGFTLPQGTFPIPQFPLEGMLTREVNLGNPSMPKPYPLRFLETSSPGLRGQSGGPTFDTKGTIFAIQSRTQHFPLGFDTYHGEGKRRELVPQFLNVGWGVHVATVVGLLNEVGVQHDLATY